MLISQRLTSSLILHGFVAPIAIWGRLGLLAGAYECFGAVSGERHLAFTWLVNIVVIFIHMRELAVTISKYSATHATPSILLSNGQRYLDGARHGLFVLL